VSRDQLQVYLDEFVFRHNRRRLPMAAFQTLLGLAAGRKPTTYKISRYRAPRVFPNLTPTYHARCAQLLFEIIRFAAPSGACSPAYCS
jgi:hypothetical protein